MKIESAETNQRVLTFLGYLGAVPFLIGALIVWTTPVLVPVQVANWAACASLAYGAVIVAYMAGMGGGAMLAANQPSGGRLLAGMVATIAGWIALWPYSDMTDGSPALIRYMVVIGALWFLCFQDLAASRSGEFPAWYAPLRIRLTLAATVGLAGIVARIASGSP